MSNKTKGKDFEAFVHSIYEAALSLHDNCCVKLDEKIESPDGPRQFDITVRHNIAGSQYLTVIECKNHKSLVDVKLIDAFHSKSNDVNASKAIFVASSGYSKQAKRKAARYGIELSVAGDAAKDALRGAFDIPVVVRRVSPVSIARIWRVVQPKDGPIEFDQENTILGVPAMEIIMNAFQRGIVISVSGQEKWKFISDKIDCLIDLEVYFGKNLTIDIGGHPIPISEPMLGFRVQESYHFGHLTDIESARHLLNLSTGAVNTVVPLSEFEHFHTKLVETCDLNEAIRLAGSGYIECIVIDYTVRGSQRSIELWRGVN